MIPLKKKTRKFEGIYYLIKEYGDPNTSKPLPEGAGCLLACSSWSSLSFLIDSIMEIHTNTHTYTHMQGLNFSFIFRYNKYNFCNS